MNLSFPVEEQSLDLPTSRHAELVVRVIESAAAVQRRYQFFVWEQSYLQMLLPHQISVCSAYQRSHRELVFETFYNVPVASELLTLLGDGQSALMREVVRQWVERSGGCVVVDLDSLSGRLPAADVKALARVGLTELIAHGVARPQRPNELESLFVLAAPGQRWEAQHRTYFELLLPHLHTTYIRVQVNERTVGTNGLIPAQAPKPERKTSPITARECQILRWAREGKSNLEIAAVLAISPLTVKNHMQKILRKLGASNRAQAVAQAIDQKLL
jgi:transcriptional regulator EpsA